MKTYNVKIKTTKITFDFETIEADSLEDARFLSEEQFVGGKYDGISEAIFTEVVEVTEDDE